MCKYANVLIGWLVIRPLVVSTLAYSRNETLWGKAPLLFTYIIS